jgi:hypothetical protein
MQFLAERSLDLTPDCDRQKHEYPSACAEGYSRKELTTDHCCYASTVRTGFDPHNPYQAM